MFRRKVKGSSAKYGHQQGRYCETAQKNRGRGVAEKNQNKLRRQENGPENRAGEPHRPPATGFRIHTAFLLLPPSRGSQIRYTLPSHLMAPLLSPPLLADSVTKFHAASTAVPCSGSSLRYAITWLAGAGRRDRHRCRRTWGSRGLRVEAVAAESRSSDGGVAEDYYAVLGVVGASSSKHSFCIFFPLF